MFRADVEIGSLADAGDRFEAAYQGAVQGMKAILDAKAEQERSGHGYQSRSGDLEASTYASDVFSTGDADEVQLGAREPYAVYVNARGLMGLDELAAAAEGEIGELFEALSRAI